MRNFKKRPTPWIIFEGKLDSKKIQRLSRQFLISFIELKYLNHHRLHMKPAHTSISTCNLEMFISNYLLDSTETSEEISI